MGDLVDARSAARLLGVDVRTLYAYVSRGSLRRVPGPDGRSSRYDSDELDLLARRSRPRTLPRPAASIDLVIATRVSAVTDGLVRYRGIDVLDLVAAGESFETIAGLLWSGQAPTGEPPRSQEWRLPVEQAARVGSIVRALGDRAPVTQRFAAAVGVTSGAALSAGGPPDWAASGRLIVATFIAASGPGGGAADPGDDDVAGYPVARRLWRRWSPLRPSAPRVRALNTALVLLAEHELALSTLAVRVAASGRAGPSDCVLAGLGALSGPLHGGASRIIRERHLSGQAGRDGRDEGEGPLPADPGFGHTVHRHGDPRAGPLLRAVRTIATAPDRDLIEGACRRAPGAPTVDFALGALCHVGRMPPEAAAAIFATARTTGWIAHAAEEYAEPPLRFRGRAVTSTSTTS
jgi:citrate synthase